MLREEHESTSKTIKNLSDAYDNLWQGDDGYIDMDQLKKTKTAILKEIVKILEIE